MVESTANDKPVPKSTKTQRKSKDYQIYDSSSPVSGSAITAYYKNSDTVLTKYHKSIKSVGLFDFLKDLGFPLEIARHYFHEVHVYHKQTHEEQKTLGFRNVDDGFELINPFFKGSVGIRNITFIRGIVPKPEVIHIFADSLDFLSFLSKIGGKKILADVIILHSYAFVENIKPYIHGFGYRRIYSWMENDKAGAEAKELITNIVKMEEELKHKVMNNLYKPYKNLHIWYKQRVTKEQ